MTNPLLQTDFYKVSHMMLYPEGTQYVYETLTPRKNSYFPWNDKMTVFGYELFFHRLHERFQKEFFDLQVEEAVDPVVDTIAEALSQEVADKVKPQFVKLHELGYLPLRVQALPEGVLVPMQVPVLTIENTDPDFYWLPGYLETSLLSDTFVTSTVASTTRQFKVSGYKYALKTGAISVLGKAIEAKLFLESKKQLSDITDVDESIDYMDFQFHDFSERGQHGNEAALLSGISHLTSSHGTDIIQAVNYVRNNYPDKDNLVGASVLATEHSVMEAYGTDQYKAYETLLNNNPTGILSVVSDTYDYWEVINDVLPALKDLIMSRDGKLTIRPDSLDDVKQGLIDTLDSMWDTFGGTVDNNGIKVLDSHIGLLHGEGVSLDNIDEYFEAIVNAGYSPENIVFGVGAYVYSVQASRDSFGQALKATSVTINGEEKKVFKDPKTVSESFKKSLKGRVRVVRGDKGYEVQDDLLSTEVGKDNELKTIYEPSNGKTESLVTPFEVIRKRIDMSAVIEGASKVAKEESNL